MIGTINIKVSAHSPNMPLCPMFAFKGSPSSIRVLDVPKAIGTWNIHELFIIVTYPNDAIVTKQATRNGNVWVATIEGCATAGKVENGLSIQANGIDENGNAVTGYVLGKGDIYIMEADAIVPDPTTQKTYMRLCDELPDTPTKGDAYFQNNVLVIWNGTEWEPCFDASQIPTQDKIVDAHNIINADRSVQYESQLETPFWILTDEEGQTYQMTGSKTQSELYLVVGTTDLMVSLVFHDNSSKWTASLRYKLNSSSQWRTQWTEEISGSETDTELIFPTNDYTFVWKTYSDTITDELALKSDVPTKTSDLSNDSNFATTSQIPTKTSDLTNDSGFITSAEVEPYHDVLSPSVHTGAARGSVFLYTTDRSNNIDKNGALMVQATQNNDLTYNLNAGVTYFTFNNWNLTKFFENTYSPAVELIFCSGSIKRYVSGRYRTYYDGYMWRTADVGFAIPCSEGGIPDGRLIEIIGVTSTYVYLTDESTQVHTITGDDIWTSILTIDGQENQITCTRSNRYRTKSIDETFATTSQIPTVNNSTITLTQGGVTKGSFSLNQSSPQTIDLDAGGVGDNGYTVTVNLHKSEGNWQAGDVKIGGINITIESGRDNFLEFDGHRMPQGQKKFYSQSYIIIGNNTEPCVYVDGVAKNNTVVELSADATVDMYNLVCIAGGTLVSLSNGTTKPIEEVTYDDDLLVWNFDEGKLDSAKPTWIKRADYIFFHWKTDLASGKSINTCGQWGHRFFDLATNTWVYASDIEGKTIYTLDGADDVVSSKRIEGGKVYFYNIITKKHINLFCNGILAGCSLENKLYPVEGMKFVKDNRALRPYSEFQDGVPEYWYNDCRYAESNATREYLVEYYNRRKALAV